MPRQLATAPLAAACPRQCRAALTRARWCSPELLLPVRCLAKCPVRWNTSPTCCLPRCVTSPSSRRCSVLPSSLPASGLTSGSSTRARCLTRSSSSTLLTAPSCSGSASMCKILLQFPCWAAERARDLGDQFHSCLPEPAFLWGPAEHALVARPASLIFGKHMFRVFYSVRLFLGLISTITETILVVAISRKYGKRIACCILEIPCLTSGCFLASTCFLPSSFSMYAVAVSVSAACQSVRGYASKVNSGS
jgi:hypothetical protein